MSIGKRIKQIRKELNLTMEAFGKQIGVTRNSISMIESEKNNPSDQSIRSICREFGIREEWLRTGQEPMRAEQSRFDELESFVADLKTQNPDFRHRLLTILAKLRPEQWSLLEEMALSLFEETQSEGVEDDFPEDIDAKVEAYRQELLAEKRMREELARDAAKNPISVSVNSGEKSA